MNLVGVFYSEQKAGAVKGGSTASFSGANCSRCRGGGNIGKRMAAILLACQQMGAGVWAAQDAVAWLRAELTGHQTTEAS